MGDTEKFYDPPNCIVVGTPEDIPESERVAFAIPEMFSVEIVGGSDRWGRSTNPHMPDLAPFSPRQNHMYGQIKGHWYMRAPADEDRWLLRHDTFYGNIAWNGTWNDDQDAFYNLSQIHSQTRLQQENNITGPMISLNRSATWPIRSNSTDPMCVCIPDPVGVPDVSATRRGGLANLEYLGRIKLAPIEYLGRTVELVLSCHDGGQRIGTKLRKVTNSVGICLCWNCSLSKLGLGGSKRNSSRHLPCRHAHHSR